MFGTVGPKVGWLKRVTVGMYASFMEFCWVVEIRNAASLHLLWLPELIRSLHGWIT